MTRENDILYPRNSRLKFDGGKNSKFERALIQDNESPDCLNVVFDDGSVETRGGTDKLNSNSVGSFSCDGLYTRHDFDNENQTMIAWFGGTAYTWDVSTFATIGSAQSIYTAAERVYAAEYENYIFFGNGSSTPYKYNGSFTRHGVPVPTSTLTVATASTGTALTGEYRYAYTNVNSNLVESDLSPLSTTFTASSENAALSGIPTAPVSHGVNNIYLYRTLKSGTTFYRLDTVTNGTTTYEDNTLDADLGQEAPTDNGVPPNYSAILYHASRLFVIDPANATVNYSDIGNPYVFGALSFLRVGDNTFDVPISMHVYDNSIIVNCRMNPWIIYMASTDPTEWRVLRVRGAYGSRSPFSAFNYENKVMYAAVQNDKMVGFAAIEGQTVTPSASLLTTTAVGSYMQSDKIEPDIFEIQESNLKDITSIVYQNKAYIGVTYEAGNTSNNRVYVFDFSLGDLSGKNSTSWTPWTGLNARDFTILDGNLYYGTSEETGFVYQMNTLTYNDDGSAINSYMWTKEYSGNPGEENITKDFRFANLFYEKSGDYFMDFTYRVDSDKGQGNNQQIDLDPGGSLWGSMRWGSDLWGGGSDEEEARYYLGPSIGKRIQFKFSNQNTVNQKFKILGMNFMYNKKGIR